MIRLFQEHKLRKTVSLDGCWQLKTLNGEERLFTARVPGVWERIPALARYRGKVAYCRKVVLEKKTNVLLRFGAASHTARVFWNDELVAQHYSAYTAFEALVEGAEPGEHTLRVEVDNGGEDAPCVRVFRADGSWSGLAFHGVPGGHEFTSFVLGLYNAAGPGQPLEEDLLQRIRAVNRPIDLQVLVSLSCTMCPDLVTAAQRIAAENPHITAQVFDLNHFPAIKDRYNVMSVPCLVVDDGKTISFGKKNVRQLLELLNK